MIGYAIQSSAPPFPVFVMGFTITGFGLALQVIISPIYWQGVH